MEIKQYYKLFATVLSFLSVALALIVQNVILTVIFTIMFLLMLISLYNEGDKK